MDKVHTRVELLKVELVELRMDLDASDNNPHKLHEILQEIAAKSKELDGLQKSLETLDFLDN
jgi:hypothetical protein